MNDIRFPESLDRNFRAFRKTRRTIALLTAFFATLFLCGAVFLVFALTERFIDTPPSMRTVFLALFLLVPIPFLVSVFLVWRRSSGDRSLALQIQALHPEFGDRLLSAVELNEKSDSDSGISRELVCAALGRIAKDCEGESFEKYISRKRMRRFFFLSAIPVLIFLLLFICIRQLPINSLARLFFPRSKIARFTFVKFERLPQYHRVPYAEDFEIEISIAKDSIIKARSVLLSFGSDSNLPLPVVDGKVKIKMAGIFNPENLKVRSGDFCDWSRIIPVQRPVLAEARASVTYPDYLGKKTEDIEISSGILKMPEGSSYTLIGTVNRSLSDAEISKGSRVEKMRFSKNVFEFSEKSPKSGERRSATWKDLYGFAPAFPYDYQIETVADNPPEPSISPDTDTVFMLADDIRIISIKAQDDHGVAELGIMMSEINEDRRAEAKERPIFSAAGDNDSKELESQYAFSPAKLGIKDGSELSLKAYANDFSKRKSPSKSAELHLRVLSKDEHRERVRDEIEKRIEEFRSSAWQEETLLDSSVDAEGKETAASPEKRELSALSEQLQNRRLAVDSSLKNAENAVSLLNEAAKNKEIPSGVVERISDAAKEAFKAHSLISESEKKLESAFRSEQSSEKKAELEKSRDLSKNAIDSLNKGADDLRAALDGLSGLGLPEEAAKIARKEKEISEGVKKVGEDKKKAKPKEKNQAEETAKKKMESLRKEQDKVKSDIADLQKSLQRGFAESGDKSLLEAAEVIEKEKIMDKSDDAAKHMASNDLQKSEKKASELADAMKKISDSMAEQRRKNGETSAANEEDSGRASDMLRMALAQQRILEESRALLPERGEKGADSKLPYKLASDQSELRSQMSRLVQDIPQDSPLRKMAERSSDSMEKSAKAISLNEKAEAIEFQESAISDVLDMISAEIEDSLPESAKDSETVASLDRTAEIRRTSSAIRRLISGGGGMKGKAVSDAENLSLGAAEPFNAFGQQKIVESRSGLYAGEIPEECKEAVEAYHKAISGTEMQTE